MSNANLTINSCECLLPNSIQIAPKVQFLKGKTFMDFACLKIIQCEMGKRAFEPQNLFGLDSIMSQIEFSCLLRTVIFHMRKQLVSQIKMKHGTLLTYDKSFNWA